MNAITLATKSSTEANSPRLSSRRARIEKNTYWLTGPGWERLRERPEGPTPSGSGEQDSDPEGVAMLLVARGGGVEWRLEGAWSDAVVANRFLAHLATRGFSPATIRAYAYDLVNFGRFALEYGVCVADAVPTDFFDYLDWQARSRSTAGAKVVRLADRRGPAPATMNRRIAAVRGLFEFAVTAGLRAEHPVPTARRSSGLRPKQRGLLGHIGPGRARAGGRLVRQPRRLPEALEPAEVAAFVADLATHRDRAMALGMLLGGLRAGEVRSLRLADVDMGLRRVRVVGKGGRERLEPVDRAFFAELAGYLG